MKHKSDCATNNAPALETGPCDCGDAVAKGAVEDLPLPALEFGIVKSDETLSQFHHWNRIGTSWQANLFMDFVKMHTLSTVLTGSLNPDGSQERRELSAQECVDRSTEIIDLILAELERRQGTCVLPTVDDLREDSGRPVGFTPRDV
jgi:hypothetical protein